MFRISLVLMSGLITASLLQGCATPDASFYTFPNQSGALTPAELQAAAEAMKPASRGESLPLAASGRRDPGHVMPAYAVYASPPASESGRLTLQRRVICNLWRPAVWRCSEPHDVLRVTANGVNHIYSYQVVDGSRKDVGNVTQEDIAQALDITDYVYSACFASQFKALGGSQATPQYSTHPIHTITRRSGTAYGVITGLWPDEDHYSLEAADRKAGGCAYRMVTAQLQKQGLVLPARATGQ